MLPSFFDALRPCRLLSRLTIANDLAVFGRQEKPLFESVLVAEKPGPEGIFLFGFCFNVAFRNVTGFAFVEDGEGGFAVCTFVVPFLCLAFQIGIRR